MNKVTKQKREPFLLVVDEHTPARSLTIDDLTVGDVVEQQYTFDAGCREAFRVVANDRAPVHDDERFARGIGLRGPIIQGLCVTARFSRLIGMYLPGTHAILERIDSKFRRPTYEGQPLTFRTEVQRILVPMKVVRLSLSVHSDEGAHVSGQAQCLVR